MWLLLVKLSFFMLETSVLITFLFCLHVLHVLIDDSRSQSHVCFALSFSAINMTLVLTCIFIDDEIMKVIGAARGCYLVPFLFFY